MVARVLPLFLNVAISIIDLSADCIVTNTCSEDWNCGSAPRSVLTDTRGASQCNTTIGQCECDVDGYNVNSCLPDNNGCTMCQASISSSDLINYPGWISGGSFYYCFNQMNIYNYHSVQNEIRAIGVYEASSDHTQSAPITINLKTCSPDLHVSKPLILLLSSYEAVDWTITTNDQILINNLQINYIQALSYKYQTTTVSVSNNLNLLNGYDIVYPHSTHWDGGYGYGNDQGGERTAKMIYQAPSILGDYVYSFIGQYRATVIHVCVGNQNRPRNPYYGLVYKSSPNTTGNTDTPSTTMKPSQSPSEYTTISPSNSPTQHPFHTTTNTTIIATKQPSQSPSAQLILPTQDTTISSSNSPTMLPYQAATNTTTTPLTSDPINQLFTSIEPSMTVIIDTNQATNTNITERSNSIPTISYGVEGLHDEIWMILICIAFGLLFIIASICCCILCATSRKASNEQQGKHTNTKGKLTIDIKLPKQKSISVYVPESSPYSMNESVGHKEPNFDVDLDVDDLGFNADNKVIINKHKDTLGDLQQNEKEEYDVVLKNFNGMNKPVDNSTDGEEINDGVIHMDLPRDYNGEERKDSNASLKSESVPSINKMNSKAEGVVPHNLNETIRQRSTKL